MCSKDGRCAWWMELQCIFISTSIPLTGTHQESKPQQGDNEAKDVHWRPSRSTELCYPMPWIWTVWPQLINSFSLSNLNYHHAEFQSYISAMTICPLWMICNLLHSIAWWNLNLDHPGICSNESLQHCWHLRHANLESAACSLPTEVTITLYIEASKAWCYIVQKAIIS